MKTAVRFLFPCLLLLGFVWSMAAQEVRPTSYDLTNGDVYLDDTYTGGTGNPATGGSALVGGAGQLIDGKVGVDNPNVDLGQGAGQEWVAWDTIRPVITFHFTNSTAFANVAIHSTSYNSGLWGAVQVEVSDDPTFPTAATTTTNFYPTYEQRVAGVAAYLVVPVTGTGRHVRLSFDDGYQSTIYLSEVKFNLTGLAATPAVALVGGGTAAQTPPISLTSNTLGAELRYTIDGSEPMATSTLYTTPFRLSAAATVKARAFKTNYAPSATASLAVDIGIKGTVLREYFATDSDTLSVLATQPEFPTRPARREFVTSLSSSPNWDYYGSRMRGYIYPPVTGSYRFRLQSDGQGAVYLSTDTDPAHAVQIAMEPNFSGSYAQISNPVTLTAGQRYYIEAQQVDLSGGDSINVGWDIPDDPATPAADGFFEGPIPGSRLAPFDVLVPRLSPDGGTFAAATNVTLLEPTPTGVTVTYTTNGSDPTSASTAFPAAGLSINANTTLKLRSQNAAGVASPVVTAVYRIDSSVVINHEAMELWLRADVGITASGGFVDQWLDQSGKGRHARQTVSNNRPGYAATGLHNQASLTFNGSTQSLTMPAGFDDFSQGFTAFVVAQPVGTPSYGRFFDLGLNQSFQNVIFGRVSTSADFYYALDQRGTVTATSAIEPSVAQVFEVVQEPSERVTLYRDGAQVAQDRLVLPTNILRTRNFIGRSNYAQDALYGGQIAEVMIFRRALSDTERASIESYLAARYTPDTIVAMPQISPNGGAFTAAATPAIALTSATSGAEIHYTLDGTDPTLTSPIYNTPFTLTAGATVKVRAFKSQVPASRIAQASFDLAPAVTGYALAEYFNSPERVLGDLTTAATFPTQPFAREYLDGLSSNPGYANYGTRLRAYVRAPITGAYRFRMSSDDGGALYLSPDDNPAHKKQIAFEPLAAAATDYRQVSAPVTLQAGVRYYLEALQSGIGGPNGLSIGWDIPDDPATTTVNEAATETPIPATRLIAYSASDVVGQFAPIDVSPGTGVYSAGLTAKLTSVVPSGATVRYTTNGTDPSTGSNAFPAGGLAISADATLKIRVFPTGAGTASSTTTTIYRFDTTSTFSHAGLQLWLRADTGVETNANGVMLWRDLSGSGNHAAQGEAAQQPGLTASSINGKPAITFDGSDDGLFGSPKLIVGRPSTVFMVYKRNAGSAGRLLQSGSGHNWLLGPYSGTGGFYAEGWVRQNQVINVGVPLVAEAVQTPTASMYYSNGQNYTDDSTPTGLLGRMAFGGALGTYHEPCSGDIAEVLVYDHALSDSERLDVERYLAARYATFTPQVAAPQISPASGKETAALSATITSVTPGAEIRYTLDGTTPTQTSTLYSGPIAISTTKTLKARAFKANNSASVVAETRYDYTTASVIPLANLQLWLKGDGPMSRNDNGRVLRWGDLSGQGHDAIMTENERQPLWQDAQISALPVVHLDDLAQGLRVDPSLNISQPATTFLVMRVRNGGSGNRLLQARSGSWLLGPYTNILGFYADGWVSPTNISLTFDVPHLSIGVQEPTRSAFYLDGANRTDNPYPNRAVGQLVIGGPGQNDGYANADVAEVIVYNSVLSTADRYTVEQYLAGRYGIATAVETPEISPTGGVFNSATGSISITDPTPGATIRYTTDGTDPTSSSPIYSATFTLSTTATVKAKAFKSGLTDSTGAVATFTVNTGGQGGIARQLFHGGNGTIASLYGSADYPNNPFLSDLLSSFSSTPNLDSYSTRIRGYIYAPVTGAYIFRLNADDTARVFLSTDESPANAVQILSETSAASLNDYRQVSSPITLVAGKRYYMEAVHSEGGGADFVQVGWTIPDDPSTSAADPVTENPIPGSRLSPYGETDVPNQLPSVTLSPRGGTYSGPVSVSLASPVPAGASVYYTTNGTDPTTSSTLYTGAFTVSATSTVKARMFRNGAAPSVISSTLFSFDSSTFFTRSNLALWYRSESGADVDGSGRVLRLADQSGNARDAVQSDVVRRPLLAANAFGSRPALRFDGSDDTLNSGYFVQHGPRTLIFLTHYLSLTSPSGYSLLGVEGGSRTYLGIRNGGQPYYGAVDREGTYGPDVLNTSTLYVMSLVIDGRGTARAYINNQLLGTIQYFNDADANVGFSLGSLADNWEMNADVPEVLLYQSALSDTEREKVEYYLANRYGAARTVAAPAISPQGGTYAATVSVTLGSTTPNATVRYTTDGSDPTATSLLYSTAFNVSAAQTVKAKAFLSGTPSATASADFAFDAAATITHSGLQLWLRADRGVVTTGGAVSTWKDQSGQGLDATQTTAAARPTVDLSNGSALPGLVFDGSADYLSLPAGFDDFTQGVSAFVVVEPTTAASYARFFDLSRGAFNQGQVTFCRNGTDPDLLYFANATGQSDARVVASGVVDLNVRQLFEVVQSSTGSVAMFENGLSIATGSGAVPLLATRLENYIGKSIYNDALYAGRIAEVIIYNRSLSASERQAVEAYLRTRNNVQTDTAVAPAITPNGGVFTNQTSFTLGTTTAGATIRYTLDGTDPSGTSTAYASSVPLTSSKLVKARTFAPGFNPSDITAALFSVGDAAANGDGVAAEYFASEDLTGSSLKRRENNIDLDFGTGSPDVSVPVDHFSARFTGTLRPRYSENFTFSTLSDDGVRLWIDLNNNGTFESNELLIDDFTVHSNTERLTAAVALVKGTDYAFKLEYFESTGQADVRLSWSSFSQAKQAIPQSQLFSGIPSEVVATPVLNPVPGTYGSGLQLALTTTTSGATIRYSLAGNDVTSTTGNVYSAPVTLTSTVSVKARAFKPGAQDSGLAQGTYTIDSTPPFISSVTFRGAELHDGDTLGGSGLLGLTATDTSGVSKAEFYVKPAGGTYVLLGTDVTSGNGLTQQWDNSSLADGDYVLAFIVYDAFNQKTTVTRSIHLALAARPPDLQVATVGVTPAAVKSGDTITIAWSDTNAEGSTATAGWSDRIRVFRPSNNAAILDTLKFHDPAVEGTLAVGATLLRSQTFKMPDGPAGTGDFRVEITVDGSNTVAEFNSGGTAETNNTTGINFTTTLGNYPDLEVRNLVVSPVSLASGATATVRWNAQNTGSAAVTGAFSDRLVVRNASNNETVYDQVLGGDVTGTLAAGGKRARQASVDLPQGARGSGTFTFTVTTDSGASVAEYNVSDTGETNNVSSTTVSSSLAASADLIVTSITAPANALPGQTIDVAWTIKNQGTKAAPAGWTDQILLSEDAMLGGDRLLGTSIAPSALAIGASVNLHASVTLPSLTSGPKYLCIIANAGGDSFEGDLTNNGKIADAPTNITAVLALSFERPSIAENGGSLTATLTRNGSTSAALSVSVQALPTGLLTLPASVTIPAGQASAAFAVTPIDDTLVNGTRTGNFAAHATGYTDATATLTVTDDDVPSVLISISPVAVLESVSNTPPAVTGTVRRNGDTMSALTVALLSSNTAAATVPASVVMAKGSSSVTFPITIYDDNVLTGTRTVRFTASAAGLTTTSTTLDVLDDDVPNLSLRLQPDGVSENAANPASFGRLTRATAPDNDLVINLSSSNSAVAAVPTQVTLLANTTAVDFPITVIDNASTDGTRNITITAVETDSRLHQPVPLQTVSAILKVYDDEGLSLSLSASADTVKTGSTLTGTVSRKPGTSGALAVTLASNQAKLTVPSSVNIPTGQASATFVITAGTGVTSALNATVTATASGANPGALGVLIVPSDLPDLAVESVTPAAATGVGGGTVNVTWMVSNNGTANATGTWTDRVFLSTDRQSVGGTALNAIAVTGPLAKGNGYTRTAAVTLPQAPGRYWVTVKTDTQNDVPESSEINNSLVATLPIDVGPAYAVTIATDVTLASSGSDIPFAGKAVRPDNSPAALVPVSFRILVNGTRRVFSKNTDAAGNYTFVFHPLASEAGHYTVAAAQPDVAADVVQDSFDLIGLAADPQNVDLRLAIGTPGVGDITLTNISARALPGLTATLRGSETSGILPANISGTITPPGSLAPGGAATLHYSITAANDTIARAKVLIHVASSDGAFLDIPVTLTVLPIASQLVANPGVLSRGMLRGAQTIVDCQLVNLGAVASGTLSVELPTGVPFLTLASPATIPSLAPGEMAKISLQLLPAATLPLKLYSGSIFVRAAQSGVSIPFQFRAISSAVGDVTINVLDDYTYYTPGAPKVPNATVKLRDAFDQSIVVAQGLTNAAGTVTLPAVKEGPYYLEVTADKHSGYRSSFTVLPGIPNVQDVFIDRQTVTYTWQVVPTEIPDRYEIKLIATFEVDVPVPVVTMDISPTTTIPNLAPGESFQVDINLTNHGLIAAQQIQVQVPGPESGFIFTPLVTSLDQIEAKSSVTIPMIVTRPVAGTGALAAQRGARFAGGGGQTAAGGGDCTGFCFAIYNYECGKDRKYHQTGQPLVFSGQVCPGDGGGGGIIPFGGPGGPGGLSVLGPPVVTMDDCDPCTPFFTQAAADCLIGFLPLGPAFGCGKGLIGCLGPSMDPAGHRVYGCERTILDCAAAVGRATPAGPGLAALDCLEAAANAIVQCQMKTGGGGAGTGGGGSFKTSSARTVARFEVARSAAGTTSIAAPTGTSLEDADLSLFSERLARMKDEVDFLTYVFGDRAWLASRDGVRYYNWLTAFTACLADTSDGADQVTAAERATLVGPTATVPLPDSISADAANAFIDRMNRTLAYYLQGIFNIAQVPKNQSTDFIAVDVVTTKFNKGQQAYDLSAAEGFDSPSAGVLDAVMQLRARPPKKTQGVCAQVKIEIDQQAVLSRQAFSGTLEVTNGSQTGSISDVSVVLDIRDTDGKSANDKFFVQGPDVTGLVDTGGHGQLAAGATARLQYTFIPKHEAAPTAPVVYRFAGTLQYTDSGVSVSLPMLPAPVTVYPDARLTLRYFQQRDVYADDPFTPQIEPSEPFALGLIVTNTGGGIAKNFSITSAQPKIIDNQKGLLIDFKIVGTQVGAEQQTPSLTVNLGDIEPGESQTAQFLLTASLQGKFIDYQATFEHASELGGQETSLIDSVEIHELIHVVHDDRPGADNLPDFLTNEVIDANTLPDTLYLSNGSVAVVNQATNVATTIGTYQGGVTCQMPSGWGYFQVADPGAGLKLVKAVRSDGKVLRVGDNVWQTDRSFPGANTGAVRENLLHLLDFNGTGSYTLYYTQPDVPGFLPEPVKISTLGPVTPALRTAPVSTVDVVFTRPIDPATLTGADVTLQLNDGGNLLGGMATTTQVDEVTYRIGNLSGFNAAEGTYALKVNANTVADVTGQAGQGSASAVWAVSTSHLAALSIGSFGGVAIRGPLDTVDVVFSRAVDPSTFATSDLSLKRGGGAELSGSLSITQISPTTFRLGGLGPITGVAGDYALTIFTSGLKDTGGVAGVGRLTENFTIDNAGPTIVSLDSVVPNPRNSAVSSLNLVFSKPVASGSFKSTALKLKRNNKAISLGTTQIIAIDSTHYRLAGLAESTGLAGSYQLDVDAAGVTDALGNPGSGVTTRTWALTTAKPSAPSSLRITPDTGVSATDKLTDTGVLTIGGSVAKGSGKVRVMDVTTGLLLGDAAIVKGKFTLPVVLTLAGLHDIALQAMDEAGNSSAVSSLRIFIDMTAPSVSLAAVTPATRSTAVLSEEVTFSETLRAGTLTLADITLKRDGTLVPLKKITLRAASGGFYVLDGLGAFTDAPGIYELTVSAANVEDLAGNKGSGSSTVTWRRLEGAKTQSFTSFAGSYTGLILAPEPTHATSGIVTAKLARTGTFTATALYGGVKYSFRGKLDNEAKWHGVAGSKANAVSISLSLVAADDTEVFLGTVGGAAGQTSFVADRLVSTAAQRDLAGQYVMLLNAPENAAPGLPLGDGYGILSIGTTGLLRAAGELADGTKFSQATPLSGDDEWPLYLSLDKGKGSFVSRVFFRESDGVSDFDGAAFWFRTAHPKAGIFSGAFTTPLPLIGSKYTPPTGTQPVFDFGNTTQQAQLVLSQGGLADPLTLPFSFNTKGVATFTTPGLLAPKLALSLKDGRVGGSLKLSGEKAATAFKGVVFPKQLGGGGYFIHLPNGGAFELQAAPAQ